MAEERTMNKAREVYRTVCAALDSRSWKYKKTEEDLTVGFGIVGEDIPLHFVLISDAERQMLRLISPLPVKMSEDKRVEGAVAALAATYNMVQGSFDYDLSDGHIAFRVNSCFLDSTLGQAHVLHLIDLACAMVEKHNDRFLALNEGGLSLADFLSQTLN